MLGEATVQTVVRAEHCDALAARHLAHVAVVDAAAPYTVVRTHLSGAFMQVCLSGEGQTLLDGRVHHRHVGDVARGQGIALFGSHHRLHGGFAQHMGFLGDIRMFDRHGLRIIDRGLA